MPGLLAAFFALVGLGAGSALADKQAPIWGRPDRPSHSSGHYRAPQEYRVWTSVPGTALAGRDGKCHVTAFALSTRQHRVRLQIADRELRPVDWSWTYEMTIAEGYRQRVPFTFLDPTTGAVLAERTAEVSCYPDPGIDWGVHRNADGTLKGYEE